MSGLKCVTPEEFNDGIWYTIDPGVHTAIVLWKNGTIKDSVVIPLMKYKTLGEKIHFFQTVIRSFSWIEPGDILIEGVDIRATSEVSMASAGRGNLSLLSYIIGAICGIFISEHECVVHDPILYREWAGQLSYEQLRNILRKKFKIETSNEHMAAAIGIGLAAKGEL